MWRAVNVDLDQRAVNVDPEKPNFTGLRGMLERSLGEAGGLSTKEFAQRFDTVAEADARQSASLSRT